MVWLKSTALPTIVILLTPFLASMTTAFPFVESPLLESSSSSSNLSPAKLQPRAPQATRNMGRRKRSKDTVPQKKDYSSFLCPGGSYACPAPGTLTLPGVGPNGEKRTRAVTPKEMEAQLNSLADWFRVGFECVDYQTETESCGGCVTLGSGEDCSLIPQSRKTGCESGTCVVYQCKEGFAVGSDKKSCERKQGGVPTGYGLEEIDDVVDVHTTIGVMEDVSQVVMGQ